MTVQMEEVRELVDFAPEGFLVTSFHLNVDAAEFPSDKLLETSFDSLIHTAESRRKEIEDGLSHEASESLRSDVARIREFFSDGFDRSGTRGLSMFSCSAQNFWQTVQLPTPVENRVVLSHRPFVAPIAAFLSQSKPTAVLVTDKQHARIFTIKGSEVREWTDFEDAVPQRSDQGGWSQMRFQRRSDNWRKHHLDHAAELVLRLLQHEPFEWLIVGNEVQTQADLEQGLHPYVKDRVIGRINVRADAPEAEIVEKARALLEQAQAQHITELTNQILEFAGAGGRGTVGLTATLQALNEQKVHILVVQQGFEHPGAECAQCGLLLDSEVQTCPACNGPAHQVEDIVELAIQKALELGSTVEVATEQDALQPVECIGSILYY